LIEGIRTEMAIDLDPSPSFDKIIPAVSREADNNRKAYLVVGGSHTDNMAEAMRRKGDLVDAVVFSGWRAQKKLMVEKNCRRKVELMVEKMKLAMENRMPNVIVLQVLDENVFLTLAEDGTHTLTGIEYVAGVCTSVTTPSSPTAHSTVQPAKVDKDGKMHMEGWLTTASEATLQILLKLLVPLWLATEGHDTIVILPIIRYVTAG
jgi:hypothetical protein